MTEKLYFDDLQIGQTFESRTSALDEAQIKTFAAEYDPQPFHLDDELAKETVFAGLAASGWHTAALSMRLMVESLPIAGGLIGLGADISWPKAVRASDVLNLVSEVVEKIPSKSRQDRGIVKVRCTTFNQNGETVQILTPTMIVPRRVS